MRAVFLPFALGFVAACGVPEEPTLDSVRITPEVLYAGDHPTCEALGFFSAEGGADQSMYLWSIGEMPVGTEPTLADDIRGGNVVTCTVYPDDGEMQGEPVSASITVSNTPPSYANAQISPLSAPAGGPISCAGYGWYDPDGDLEITSSSTIAWTRDGIAVFNGTQTMLPGPTEAGHTYGCTVTPDDGEDQGEPVHAEITF